jgi:tetraprenyl-beta-curcumene synthase
MSDRKFAMRAGLALVLANLRYWSSVAPIVRDELDRWLLQAEAIPDPSLRELAVSKLRSEHFNAEVAATLGTLAPRARRRDVVEAIVALEVLYDYLDGLTERPVQEPLRSGRCLYQAFTEALVSEADEDYYAFQPSGDDGGYLRELAAAVRIGCQRLPGQELVLEPMLSAVNRCAEGQVRVHAAPQAGTEQLRSWAQANRSGSQLGWREYVAGSVASVLAAHALIAVSAGNSITAEEARATDAAYLSISAMSTMLDSLIDYEGDVQSGEPWLVGFYGDPQQLGDQLAKVAGDAATRARSLPHGAHHYITLVGVVAYYASASEARGELVAPLLMRLRTELRPVLGPTLAVMRVWRLAKRARAQVRTVSGTKPT